MAAHPSMRRAGRLRLLACACAALLAAGQARAFEPQPPPAPSAPGAGSTRNVLVLYSNSRLLPAAIEADRGLRESLQGLREGRVRLFEEYLDSPRIAVDSYADATVEFLRSKYASQPPDVVVAGGPEMLRFLLARRAQLFPGAPIVHEGVGRSLLPRDLPRDVVGVPHEVPFDLTLDLALALQPQAARIVFITQSAPGWDNSFQSMMRSEARRLAGRLPIDFITDLPHTEVLERVSRLPRDTIVFTPGYFIDGVGRSFQPSDALRDIARAASAPVYSAFDTSLGTGIVGGVMQPFREVGREAGSVVNALLAGADPATLKLSDTRGARPHVDWRQLERWGISSRLLPADTVVHFRQPGLWEAYRQQVLLGLLVLVLQGGLIVWLLAERLRRRRAEQAVAKQRFALAHASRLAVAGELTAAIAHEINQPLAAILSNAEAAEMILERGGDRREELQSILADIRRDDQRASEVIRRLRALLAHQEAERRSVDVNTLTVDAVVAVRGEARRRGVVIEVITSPAGVTSMGDRIQMQQVIINLIMNAMDAVEGLPDERRHVSVAVMPSTDRVRVSVRDRGPGIAAEHLPRLFKSFFTTKRGGMGLGLSIVRTLVESQGGRVWAESPTGGGAAFHVEWPLSATRASLPGAA